MEMSTIWTAVRVITNDNVSWKVNITPSGIQITVRGLSSNIMACRIIFHADGSIPMIRPL